MPAIRVSLAALLISFSCLAAAAAQADEESSRLSFGSQIGLAEGSEPAPLEGDVSTMSYDVSATFGDKSRIGWRVFTGYRFTDYLALQVGYTDLGKVKSGLPVDPRELQTASPGTTQTVRGIDVGLQLKLPLSEHVSMEFRGGQYYWQSRTHTTDVWGDDYRATRRDSDAFYGVGMEFALLEEFSATLGWTHYDVGGEPVALWTIGTLYRFSVY